MTADMLSRDLSLLLPELILAGGAMALLMLGVFLKRDGDTVERLVQWLTIGLLVAAGLPVGRHHGELVQIRGQAEAVLGQGERVGARHRGSLPVVFVSI